jgi:hypothetical protein
MRTGCAPELEDPMTLARITALAGLAASLTLAGCASYATYPPVAKNIAINDTNSLGMTQVMTAGLGWVVAKYPPGAKESSPAAEAAAEDCPFAINLPEPTNRRTYERVAESLGHGARPLSEDTSHLPIYHVSYVRIRGDEAQVHIVRPVPSLGNDPTGAPIVQEIKLQLRGGFKPWTVIAAREWQVGAADVPPLNFYHAAQPAAKPMSSKTSTGAFVPNPTANSRITAPATPREPDTATAPESPNAPD